MRKITFLILVFTINSCKSLSTDTKINYGTFISKGDDYYHSLLLNSDSTFVINFKYFEIKASCFGKWNNIGKDSLIINCDKPKSFGETLQSGYINEREMYLKIINKNDLQFKNTHFIRITN